MENKEPYSITVKAILIFVFIALLLGVGAGWMAARLETQAFLKNNPLGSKVIQTIQTQTADPDSYQGVVAAEKDNVVGLLDAKSQIVQTGTVLTADGLFVTPSSEITQRSVQVMLADGKIQSATRVRSFPEKGLIFYRVGGVFSAPQFKTLEALSAGAEGVAIRLTSDNANVAAGSGMVEYFAQGEALDGYSFRERQAKLVASPGGRSTGAPFFDRQRNLLGVIADGEKGIVLPAEQIDFLLQDYLKHGAEESVSVLGGLEGSWVTQTVTDGNTVTGFSVEAVAKGSNFAKAGLIKQDLIVSLNDKTFPGTQLWQTCLENARAGKPITLGIIRNKETLKLPITIIIQNDAQQQ